jgi:hypothetical protein
MKRVTGIAPIVGMVKRAGMPSMKGVGGPSARQLDRADRWYEEIYRLSGIAALNVIPSQAIRGGAGACLAHLIMFYKTQTGRPV